MRTLNLDHFVTARSAFRRRQTAARAMRLGREIRGAEFDDFGMGVEMDGPPAPPLAFHLIYTDAKQQLTGRCVTLRELLYEIADVRLKAYCHMRRMPRCFMASRIAEVTDLATGEVHEDALGFFRQHPLLRQMNAADACAMTAETMAIQERRDEIIILSFVGASDGEFDEDEQEQIVRHVMLGCDEPLNERVVRERIRAWVPDEPAFYRALQRMCDGEGDAEGLMRSMRRVIDADGEVDPEEVAFAAEIQSRLTAAGRLA